MTAFKKYSSHLSVAAGVVFMGYMLVMSDVIATETKTALKFCFTVLVPSLFANTVIACYLLPRLVNAAKGKYVTFLAVTLGLVCGFPVGANIASSLEKNCCDKSYCKYINAIANNASISFVISFAGIGVLKSVEKGVILVALQVISTVICGFVTKWLLKPTSFERVEAQNEISFAQSLKNGVSTMLNICGSVVMFGCIGTVLLRFFEGDGLIYIIMRGILEFSSGINLAATLSSDLAFVLTAFFVGWSGFCVAMQVRTAYGNGTGVYFLSKLLQGTVMALLAVIFVEISR